MSKCFICYRHTKPDKDIANFLETFLKQHGHNVFIDTGFLVGMKWAKEIEKQIESSDVFIVLLSRESILSDIVRQEVKLAHRLSQKRGTEFTIMPIRVDFTGELPYDLGAYLDRIQYAVWQKGDDFEIIGGQILNAVEKHAELPIKEAGLPDEAVPDPGVQSLFDVTEAIGAPLPAADPRLIPQLELDTGTVKLDSPFYVKREADSQIIEQISQKGSTTIVMGPHQMGKSSLLARAHAVAKIVNQQSCFFDFQMLDESNLTNLDQLFKYLALRIYRTFKPKIEPSESWDEYLGPKQNLTRFIKKVLLEKTQLPVVILLDEVDRLFNYPFRDDFFATIRVWHNLRAIDDCWNRLNVVIAHSTEPYLWIQDMHQSPFNVGYMIEMKDFEFQQVKGLNTTYGAPLKTDREIHELMDFIGGHPFLVKLALYILKKENYNLSRLKEISLEDKGPFGDHLRRFLWHLHGKEKLKNTLLRLIHNGTCDDETHFLRLKAAGLVKGKTRSEAQMRCQLYKEYFRNHL